MKKYMKAYWHHEFEDEPYLFYSEMDINRYETRKVEIYINGVFGYAAKDKECNQCRLGTVPIPSLEDINSKIEFEAIYISSDEFNEIWDKYVKQNVKKRVNING